MIAVEYLPWFRYGGSLAVVRRRHFEGFGLSATLKSGYNDVGISTISFSGFGPNPAGFAQIRVGQGSRSSFQFIWNL